MRTLLTAVLYIAALVLLPGCWNAVELDEWGFVQGVAIDAAETGEIELTVLFYKPNPTGKGQGGGADPEKTSVSLKTRDQTIFEAIRDITVHVGRKAQWSHMRVMVISEEIAKKRDIRELIDFFARDHEPRGTAFIMIGKGKADQYVKVNPIMETSMGQQMREAERMAYQFAGKTLKTNIVDLSLELKGQTGVSAVPYVYFDPKNKPQTAPITGLALLKEGKLKYTVPSERIEGMLMLMDKYDAGIIEIACPEETEGKMKRMEAVEVEKIRTKTSVKLEGEPVAVRLSVDMKGFVGELLCTALESPEDLERLNQRVEETVEQDMRQSLDLLQKQKLDALGIGNRIYRKDPALWSRLKPDWDNRFANIPFTIEVKANVYNTGANMGKAVGK